MAYRKPGASREWPQEEALPLTSMPRHYSTVAEPELNHRARLRWGAELVVLGSGLSVIWRTPDESFLWIAILAAPAVLGVALTRGRRLELAACGLALLAWVPLGIRGDLSCRCVDGAGDWHAIPVFLWAPQFALVVASVIQARRRKTDTPHVAL